LSQWQQRHGTRTKTGEICNQTRKKTLHQNGLGVGIKEQASPVIQSKDTTIMQSADDGAAGANCAFCTDAC
jgi:hypothetical protein